MPAAEAATDESASSSESGSAAEPATAADVQSEAQVDIVDAPAGSIAELEGDPEMVPASDGDLETAVVAPIEDPAIPTEESPFADVATDAVPQQAGDPATDNLMNIQEPMTEEQAASAGEPVLDEDPGTR